MKTTNLISAAVTLAATALLAQIPLCGRAGTWETVDYANLRENWISGRGSGIGTDQYGVVYAAGSATTSTSNNVALVRASYDQGTNWAILSGSVYSDDWDQRHFLAFAAGGQDDLYVGGQAINQVGQNPSGWPESGWIVRESRDRGANWITSEIFRPETNLYSACIDVKVAPWREVYAAGYTATLGQFQGSWVLNTPTWVVRKGTFSSSMQKTVFTDVDNVTTSAGISKARGIGFFGQDGVIVVGQLRGLYNSFWTVRCSTNRGNTWTTVDNLQTSDGWTGWLSGVAEAVAVNGNEIYVAGAAAYQGSKNRNAAPTNLWLVRRSTDGGAHWETVDSFSYGSGTTPHATGITFDGSGIPVVCGYVTTATGDHWLVRTRMTTTVLVKQGKNTVPVSTVSWVTTDDWQPATPLTSQPVHITCGTDKNVYATGGMNDNSGHCNWITRKLAAPQN